MSIDATQKGSFPAASTAFRLPNLAPSSSAGAPGATDACQGALEVIRTNAGLTDMPKDVSGTECKLAAAFAGVVQPDVVAKTVLKRARGIIPFFEWQHKLTLRDDGEQLQHGAWCQGQGMYRNPPLAAGIANCPARLASSKRVWQFHQGAGWVQQPAGRD
jgi:hypothetical protein